MTLLSVQIKKYGGRELKKAHCFKTEKRRGLTRPEQELFMDYLKNSKTAVYWYPMFAVMLGTGLRVGEVTGLRWCDIDLEEGIIDVNPCKDIGVGSHYIYPISVYHCLKQSTGDRYHSSLDSSSFLHQNS